MYYCSVLSRTIGYIVIIIISCSSVVVVVVILYDEISF